MIKLSFKNKSGGISGNRAEQRSAINLNDLLRPYIPYLPVGGSVVFGALILLLVALPRIGNFSSISEEIEGSQKRLTTLKEKGVKLADLLTHQEALDSDLSVIDAALPEKENVPELLSQIEKIASESGVSIRALHFGGGSGIPAVSGKPGATGKYSTVQLQAEAEGSFANLVSFLTNIENASRLIFVDNLRFNQETVREATLLRVSLALTSFFVTLPEDTSLMRPVALNLNSSSLNNILEKLKPLRIYKINIGTGGAGRLNPFE